MRRMMILTALPLFALGACHADVDISDGNSSDGNTHVAIKGNEPGANKVAINVPGFSANVSLPNLNLGGHVDLDGIAMAPDSKVNSVDVTAHDEGSGKDDAKVRLAFTNPAAPTAVIDHYARSATDAGYTDIVRTGTSVSARKADKTFALTIAPQGTGSQGTIIVSGKD